jgi:hypothetical protein
MKNSIDMIFRNRLPLSKKGMGNKIKFNEDLAKE